MASGGLGYFSRYSGHTWRLEVRDSSVGTAEFSWRSEGRDISVDTAEHTLCLKGRDNSVGTAEYLWRLEVRDSSEGTTDHIWRLQGRDSSVGIATWLGLAGLWIESWWGEILRSVQTGFGAQTSCCTEGTGFHSCGVNRSGRGVDNPPHLALRLKKVFSDNLIPMGPLWPNIKWAVL